MSLSNRLGLLGRKVGMMRVFTDDGDAIPGAGPSLDRLGLHVELAGLALGPRPGAVGASGGLGIERGACALGASQRGGQGGGEGGQGDGGQAVLHG